MSIKRTLSKVILIVASFLILLLAIFLTQNNIWANELFDYLSLFSLVIILDFMVYELGCPSYKGRNHLVFCTFPVSRWFVIILEIKYYLKRWELFVFIISVLFYLTYFYFLNNTRVLPVILILILYILQITYLIIILFLVKHLFNIRNSESNIKNYSSFFISFIILLYSFSDKSKIIEFIFYNNPISNGFLSYLLEKNYAFSSFSLIILFSGLLYCFGKNKINEWPLF